MMLVAGVDVGGTNIMAGLVTEDHEVVDRRKEPTPTSAGEVLDLVADMVASLDGEALAVGMGVPGIVHDGRVLALPNLSGWSPETSLVDELATRTGVPVGVENDAQVGVLGEWVAGVARDHLDVLGVWMGTGVGAGLVLGGRPFSGAHGTAGELGHVTVHPGGALCGCGRRGCVEAYAGRRMLTRSARQLVESGRTTVLFELMEAKGKPRPTSGVWEAALSAGDELAEELFESAVEAVGIGVASAVNLLDPDIVVLGGGFAERLGQQLADRVAAHARPLILHDAERPFVPAALGDDSGIVGAAWVGRGALAAA